MRYVIYSYDVVIARFMFEKERDLCLVALAEWDEKIHYTTGVQEEDEA